MGYFISEREISYAKKSFTFVLFSEKHNTG